MITQIVNRPEQAYVYRHARGQDPQLMAMQARAYGVTYREEVPPVEKPAKVWGTTPQAIGMVCLMLGFLFAAARASAATYTQGITGTAGSNWSVTLDTTAQTISNTGTAADFNSLRYKEGLITDTTPTSVDGSWGAFSASPQTLTVNPGVNVCFIAVTRFGTLVSSIVRVGPSASYSVDFPLPKNTTAYPVTYKFYQGTTEVSSVTVAPGEGPETIHITGLDTDEQVYAVEYTGSLSRNDAGSLIFTPNTQWQTVSHGVPTLPGSGPSVADTPPPPGGPPAIPTPTAPVAPPTPTPGPLAPVGNPDHPTPTPQAPPNPTPSGSGGVTAADLQVAVNQLVADNNATRLQSAQNLNNINASLNAINTKQTEVGTKVIAAIDAASGKNVDGHNNTVKALNDLKTTAGNTNQLLAKIDASLQEGAAVTVPSGTLPSSRVAGTMLGVANTRSFTKLPAAPTFAALTASSSVSYTIKVPKLGDGTTIDYSFTVNFAEEPYHTPIVIFRAALLILLTLVYFIATFYAVRGAFAGK